MFPTSISWGGKLLTGGELISPASLKGQEEVLPTAKLEHGLIISRKWCCKCVSYCLELENCTKPINNGLYVMR